MHQRIVLSPEEARRPIKHQKGNQFLSYFCCCFINHIQTEHWPMISFARWQTVERSQQKEIQEYEVGRSNERHLRVLRYLPIEWSLAHLE